SAGARRDRGGNYVRPGPRPAGRRPELGGRFGPGPGSGKAGFTPAGGRHGDAGRRRRSALARDSGGRAAALRPGRGERGLLRGSWLPRRRRLPGGVHRLLVAVETRADFRGIHLRVRQSGGGRLARLGIGRGSPLRAHGRGVGGHHRLGGADHHAASAAPCACARTARRGVGLPRGAGMKLAFDTLAVHAGREDFRELGIHVPPIDLSTTNPMGDPVECGEELGHLASGGDVRNCAVYARLYNPTVGRFEKALSQLEGTEATVAFASGMAALSALLLAVREDGDHVVAVRPMYGSSDHLLASGMLGARVDFCRPDEVGDHTRPETALVFVETPSNPTLDLVDIADVVRQAGKVPVGVDSTFATPVLQRPVEQGATFVLHSGTKFLGGHGDVVAGTISTTEAWARRLRSVRVMTGALIHPLGAYLLHRGLQTLPIRVRTAQASARALAERLSGHPAV